MRYFIDPFGCVKNQVDAETMMAFLGRAGWVSAPDADSADIIIVNSCGFIESAKRESIGAVLAWRKNYPEKKILLAGCLARRYAKELARSLPEADGLFDNADLAGIAGAAEKAAGKTRPAKPVSRRNGGAGAGAGSPEAAAVSAAAPPDPGRRPLLSLPGSAYVKISEGCNNRCSFCAIPLIRGGLKSRAIPDVLEECRELLARGIGELCVIGQDIGSYGRDFGGAGRDSAAGIAAAGLPGLLEALSTLEGDFWVRLLYIHPDHFPLPILDIMERDKRFLPYFDLPFQHASAKILAAMNRRGTAESYLGLVETIRGRLPAAVIRSTFLLGFPGETNGDFDELLDFQEKARLDWLGCFTWSREEDTPAYSMKGRVAKKIAAERKRIAVERQIPVTEKQMERFIGRTLDVLVEEAVDAEEGLYLGRLYCQAPEVDGAAVIVCKEGEDPPEPGTFVKGKIFGRTGFDLQVSRIAGQG
ncbi:MAG: 30S ribosomal protein S12 methylthiotransferase RimO [Treponema sp.]|jgi:ribosomal protein S12 methylthiotransferase|nr:30S ribosomal protein S12 methylthiotransferase RimO [Treponema sp.]